MEEQVHRAQLGHGRLGQAIGSTGGQHDLGPLGDRPHREGPSHAGRGPHDQHLAVAQAAHDEAPMRSISLRANTLPTSLRGNSSTTSNRTGTL